MQYREQVMRFFADGIVALCIRSQQADGRTSGMASSSSTRSLTMNG
jgi:hypothetical protein